MVSYSITSIPLHFFILYLLHIFVFLLYLQVSLKSLASKDIWGKDTLIFFEKVEKDIFKAYFTELHQIALPGIVGVTGLAGAGVFGGIFFGM